MDNLHKIHEFREPFAFVTVANKSQEYAGGVSIFPPAVFFLMWDAIAVNRNHWSFDANQVVGIYGPFYLPIEEYLFFLIVPLAAIMTLEAVRQVKIQWHVGDEE